MDKESLNECLKLLSEEARELYLNAKVPVLKSVPSPLEFQRDWVSANKPVLIQGAIDTWPALNKWSFQYLRDTIGAKDVTVAVTPNGYADAVCDNKFVMPNEKNMRFDNFLDIIEGKTETSGVYYVQKQNSNFTDEFKEIIDDAAEELPWATESFGKRPDAVNFWLGDGRAVTSMHKDHYENLYCVVSGQKHFILHPPTDLPAIPYKTYQAAVYKENNDGKFDIIDDIETGKVPWIAIDPLKPDLDKYPEYGNSRPLSVTVRAGETLYLPSLWFHHVRQSHGCIAINFWYDMEYDIKYNYFKFIESLMKECHK